MKIYIIDKSVESLIIAIALYMLLPKTHFTIFHYFLIALSIVILIDTIFDIVGLNPHLNNKNSKQVVEHMDDPVARLYYSEHNLPNIMDTESIYKRQFNLIEKDCSRPKCLPEANVLDQCTNLSEMGSLKQTGGKQTIMTESNNDISFEDRYRSSVTGNNTEFNQIINSNKHNIVKAINVSTSHVIDKNPQWAIGMFNQHSDQNGQNIIKGAPYCSNTNYIKSVVNPDKLMGDHLSPKCAIGCTSCMPCDLTEIPLDYCKTLNDKILKRNPYLESIKATRTEMTNVQVPSKYMSIIQPHYVDNLISHKIVCKP